jgi:hypothetical protein
MRKALRLDILCADDCGRGTRVEGRVQETLTVDARRFN